MAESGDAVARAARLLLQRQFQRERDYQVRQAIGRALQAEERGPAASPARQATPSRADETANQPARQPDSALADLAVFRDAPFAPEMVVIPAGEFWMGSAEREEGAYDDERPRHRVTIWQRFAIGRYPVTFQEYNQFCVKTQRRKPEDEGWGKKRRPVINVSWEDAQAYVGWLSRETRPSIPFGLGGRMGICVSCRDGDPVFVRRCDHSEGRELQ